MYTNDELEEALERAIALMRDMRAYAEETLTVWKMGRSATLDSRLRAMAGDLRGYDSVTTDFNDFLDREGWRSD
jgi:hypothetical protein